MPRSTLELEMGSQMGSLGEAGLSRTLAEHTEGVQGALFDSPADSLSLDQGYRAKSVADLVGITYRQLDYWARSELVEPSIHIAQGSGSRRLYSFRDILILKVVKRLLDTGVSLQNIRFAISHLHDIGIQDLSAITLMSDGASVYECTSEQQVIDLAKEGQGVFAIALGPVWRDTESQLIQLPIEDVTTGAVAMPANITDELAARRAANAN